ncbi:MAG: hypothetical protein V2A79_14855 [Planctomycetota bacterium]
MTDRPTDRELQAACERLRELLTGENHTFCCFDHLLGWSVGVPNGSAQLLAGVDGDDLFVGRIERAGDAAGMFIWPAVGGGYLVADRHIVSMCCPSRLHAAIALGDAVLAERAKTAYPKFYASDSWPGYVRRDSATAATYVDGGGQEFPAGLWTAHEDVCVASGLRKLVAEAEAKSRVKVPEQPPETTRVVTLDELQALEARVAKLEKAGIGQWQAMI